MAVGDVTGPEGKTFQDHETGATIRQLTHHNAHSGHLYFTNSSHWDGGRRLLIRSGRYNSHNVFSIELATGELTQLTDFPSGGRRGGSVSFINPVRDEGYMLVGRELRALNLRTGAQRCLFTRPDGYRSASLSVTADGKTVCHAICEDLSNRIHMDLKHGYQGMAAHWEAKPNCRIFAIPTDGGEARLLREEDYWLGHVNTSPTLANMLIFCHEGPWDKVEQRIWTLAIDTGVVEPLRPQLPAERIGHEYWYADGERIGYHGSNIEGVEIAGHIRFDGTGQAEYEVPYGSYHFHSLDETLIVGDGMPDRPNIVLWKLIDGVYEGPRKLLTHRSSFHSHSAHPHPRMFVDTDGRTKVVFTADPRGYSNVFIAEIPEFESLPTIE